MECDVFAGIQAADRKHFNSRTHVECDHPLGNTVIACFHFNSRTHVECDQYHKAYTVFM